MKENKIKILHILVIIISTIILSITIFNTNIWFDEAYSLGLINQSMLDLITIAIHDVHPILYYIILKIFSLIFGTSTIVARAVSLIPVIILLIFGFTHIRKEFNEKAGLLFSFFVGFLPIMVQYSTQIRMYTYSILFITLTAFYAYKIFKYGNRKYWIIFVIFSLLSAYTHYFALFVAGIINVILFMCLLKNKRNDIKKFILCGVIQVIAYIPGLLIFIKQTNRVMAGFWINYTYPDILFETIGFYFTNFIESIVPIVFAIILFIYIIVKLIMLYKSGDKLSILAMFGIVTFVVVVAIALLISGVYGVKIYLPRYTLPMLGLIAFSLAYVLSKEKNIIPTIIIVISTLVLFSYNSYLYFNKCYDEENKQLTTIVREELQPTDIFIYTEMDTGGVIAMLFQDNTQYFYNIGNWSVKEAYKAFLPQLKVVTTLDDIENFKGRIWVIDKDYSDGTLNEIMKVDGIKVVKEKQSAYMPFSNIIFNMTLLEKN